MTASAEPSLGSWEHWHDERLPLRLGVSTCLMGENVRYDGGHARDRFVSDVLDEWFDFVPVCPEVEAGMGTPRPTVRLEDHGDDVRMVAPSTGEDFTDRMRSFAERRVTQLMELDLDGYVLKKNSPSCGMERIKSYRNGMPGRRDERGLFADELLRRWPGLPVEEDGRLNDPLLRETFIERVFCRNRWRVLVSRGLTRRSLVEFHTAHKLLLRAHDETGYRELGRVVGNAGTVPDDELFASYEREFQRTLSVRASRKKQTNVLQHAIGYLKNELEPASKREILTAIDDYRRGMLPLVVPLSLLRYEIRRHRVEYLVGQVYFDPHPRELMLRNHV